MRKSVSFLAALSIALAPAAQAADTSYFGYREAWGDITHSRLIVARARPG
jgi:hypothetical protein